MKEVFVLALLLAMPLSVFAQTDVTQSQQKSGARSSAARSSSSEIQQLRDAVAAQKDAIAAQQATDPADAAADPVPRPGDTNIAAAGGPSRRDSRPSPTKCAFCIECRAKGRPDHQQRLQFATA